jgi:hypothetical protein
MLDGPSNADLRRAEMAFGLHARAEALRQRIAPITPGEAQVVMSLGPISVFHPALARGVTNSGLFMLGSVCDGVARRLSPGLFEGN